MPINAVCPECQAAYLLADQQEGKKVRCKKCQTVFVAEEASSRRTTVRGDGGAPSQGRSRPSTVTNRRGTPSRIARDDDEDERDEPRRAPARSLAKKKGGSGMTWILVGAGVGGALFLLLCGGIIAFLVFRDKTAEVTTNTPPPNTPPPPAAPQMMPPNVPFNQPAFNPPIQGQPVVPAPNPVPPVQPANTPPAAVEDASRSRAEPGTEERKTNKRLTAEGREHVKHATVYLRVTLADGSRATGTGFFGCKEARNIILTNAHVVGMLSPDSLRPQAVEVIVHSGEANEWRTGARVLGVDRASDLAVLDIGTPTKPVPDPLTVKSAGVLRELDEVYVFGFPLGESLGKEITIRPASVSSLRKKNGRLERVQVNGGMDPGNSGGPVVDNNGDVVGVAVSIIPGRQINFAIPGERVHAILDGRISDLTVYQPYLTPDNKVAVPLAAEMIDPRNLVKQVGLEVWTGDKPSSTNSSADSATAAQAAAQAGDSPRVYFDLKYIAPEGKADIILPELPAGKVYWHQPKWVNAKGEANWALAKPMPLPWPPVYRKPATLALRYSQGSKRALDLNIENIIKLSSNDDDSDAFRIRTSAAFTETVASAAQGSTVLTLRYRQPPHRELISPDGRTHENSNDEQFIHDLPRLVTTSVQLDRVGNIVQQAIDPRPLARIDPELVKSIRGFHERIQQGLESLSVSLPPSGTANPLDSWKAERALPIETPGKTELGKIDVTFTYLGTRRRDGREEAVINMDGLVRGKEDGINGRAAGQILVDLVSGQTIRAETTVKLQLEALLSEGEKLRRIRVLDTMKFRMQRKL